MFNFFILNIQSKPHKCLKKCVYFVESEKGHLAHRKQFAWLNWISFREFSRNVTDLRREKNHIYAKVTKPQLG